MRFHLFPSRTQKLSAHTPTILGWRRPGKIGSCRNPRDTLSSVSFLSPRRIFRFMAPLCKGSSRSEAETEGLFSYRTASVHVEIQFTPLQQPFRLLLRKIHLPLHRGGKIVDSLKNACHPERMRRISERKMLHRAEILRRFPLRFASLQRQIARFPRVPALLRMTARAGIDALFRLCYNQNQV